MSNEELFEEAIASAYALAEDAEIRAARYDAEHDFWIDRALSLEAELRQIRAENG